MSVAREKKLAAEAAAQLVEDGMTVGLGTGSTVAYLLPALALRGLDLRCVATSPATEHIARDLGIKVEPFRGAMALARLDVAIDGADQVAPSGWLVKGGGGAHTREKAVAAAAERFIVIVSSDKLVERLAPPVPLELLEFGLAATLERLGAAPRRGGPPRPGGGGLARRAGAGGAGGAARPPNRPGGGSRRRHPGRVGGAGAPRGAASRRGGRGGAGSVPAGAGPRRRGGGGRRRRPPPRHTREGARP